MTNDSATANLILTAEDHALLKLAKRAAYDTYVGTPGGDAETARNVLRMAESHPHQLIVWLLQRLGVSWTVALTAARSDQWQLRIASPAHWDESFSYTYRGSLASVVARAYAGEADDGEEQVAA